VSARRARPDAAATGPPPREAVSWHDVECADYSADLPLWRELAARAGGPVLELGAGTGRVALDLAEGGHDVSALDADRELLAALAERARRRGLRVPAYLGDARTMKLDRTFALIVAPMQVVQLLGGARGRQAMLAAARRHLERGGILAVALADPFDGLEAEAVLPPFPDVKEADGWVFSSAPIAVRDATGGVEIDRLRQAVAPAGELSESVATVVLDRVDAPEVERVAAGLSYRPLARREVPGTDAYLGSTVAVLEAI